VDANALKEELKFVDGVVPEELVEVVGIVGRGESTELGDEIDEGSVGVLGDLISEGVRNAARGVEIISNSLLPLCYGELLVLPRDL